MAGFMPGVSNNMSANNNPNQFQFMSANNNLNQFQSMSANNNPNQFQFIGSNINPNQLQFMFQQQFLNLYQQYCLMNGLNPQDRNVFNTYFLMWMNNQNQNTNQGGINNYNYNFNFPNNNMNNNTKQSTNINKSNLNNNQNQTQNTQNQSQGDVYIHDDEDPNKPKEVVPRDEKTIYVQTSELKGHNIPAQNPPSPMSSFTQFQNFANSNIINVSLTASTGFRVLIKAPKDMTFEELFINFANKASIPVSAIGEQVVFLYNAEKLDPKSKSPLSSLIQASIANITVIDQAGIIGA